MAKRGSVREFEVIGDFDRVETDEIVELWSQKVRDLVAAGLADDGLYVVRATGLR